MDDERLIIAVRARDLLYSLTRPADKNYSNRDLISKAWENMAAELGNEGKLHYDSPWILKV